MGQICTWLFFAFLGGCIGWGLKTLSIEHEENVRPKE